MFRFRTTKLLVLVAIAAGCGQGYGEQSESPASGTPAVSSSSAPAPPPPAPNEEDARGDAGAPKPTTTYCSQFPSALYCEDFDRPSGVDLTALGLEATDSSSMPRVTQSEFRSSPRSLFFYLQPDVAQFAELNRAFVQADNHAAIRLSLDWWFRQMDVRKDHILQTLTLRRKDDQIALSRFCTGSDPPSCKWSITLSFLARPAGDPKRYQFFTLDAEPAFMRGWAHVVLEGSFSMTTGYLKLAIDGVDVVNQVLPTTELPSYPPNTNTIVNVRLLTLASVQGSTDALVDNVLIEQL